MKVPHFPPSAWDSPKPESTPAAHPPPEPIPISEAKVDDTQSDCDSGPRGILKRTGSASSLPRSQSTPSIRDSLDVAKEHYRRATPNSPKVRPPSLYRVAQVEYLLRVPQFECDVTRLDMM